VRVAGGPDAVQVDAQNVSLAEVLTSLRTRFNLRYRAWGALDRPVSGHYAGPLRLVIARLLEDYDFALKTAPDGLDLLVLRAHGADDKPVVAKVLLAPNDAVRPAVPAPVMTAEEANRTERR
jgi:hypothetical protein